MKKNIDKIKVSIIDYGMGNLFSVQRACEHIGMKTIITFDRNIIMSSDAIILPGVGAFGDAINNLEKMGLVSTIRDFVSTGKPFMGICLGMQLVMTESEEFGRHKGLDLIKGSVIKFPTTNINNEIVKVPQVGWNQVYRPENGNEEFWRNTPLKEIHNGERMYFVHSFYVVPENNEDVLAITDYEGVKYCSALKNGNIFACQFHPEKSTNEGLKIYREWFNKIYENNMEDKI